MVGVGLAERVSEVTALEAIFPGLRTASYRVTSAATVDYNYIAWAAGDTSEWWWPTTDGGDVQRFWPANVPREETLVAFVAAFGALGYTLCNVHAHEPGWEKMSIFADGRREPTHAARQLANGRWTSKLGESEDIEHELHALEGDIYGKVAALMKRPIPA